MGFKANFAGMTSYRAAIFSLITVHSDWCITNRVSLSARSATCVRSAAAARFAAAARSSRILIQSGHCSPQSFPLQHATVAGGARARVHSRGPGDHEGDRGGLPGPQLPGEPGLLQPQEHGGGGDVSRLRRRCQAVNKPCIRVPSTNGDTSLVSVIGQHFITRGSDEVMKKGQGYCSSHARAAAGAGGTGRPGG